ncbi:MAG TPA: hypothetical protein VGK27_11745 [Candidatus Deferrimicrobiaceae bacterium]|jgi:hypothetical protein
MGSATKQANFLLPEELIEELRATVSVRQQSRFVTDALRQALKRVRLSKALETSFGAWGEENHPELERGTDAHVRNLRRSTRGKRHE